MPQMVNDMCIEIRAKTSREKLHVDGMTGAISTVHEQYRKCER
jgi:hypothetical protein